MSKTGEIHIVVAADLHGAIGNGNKMLWHCPEDLRQFKELTMGKTVLMGRKTAESIGRPLPGRKNLVLTHQDHPPFDGIEVVHSIAEAMAVKWPGDLMVIGGGEVYRLALPVTDVIHYTCILEAYSEYDTLFPDITELTQFQVVDISRSPKDAGPPSFIKKIYRRK